MKLKINRIFIAALLYFTICLIASVAVKPFSIISFIGPAAGMAGALTMLWGMSAFVGILFGTIAFNSILILYFGIMVEPAIIIISLLAIYLQAFWVRQMTYKVVAKQKWLNSRAALFKFILKIGPMVGVVSASMAIIIAMIDVQGFNSAPLYVFITTYSASILVSVFVTPALLFSSGRQQLSSSRRLFIILFSVLACLAIALLLKISHQQQQYQRIDRFQQAKGEIQTKVKQELDIIDEHLQALSALYKSSDYVSAVEFRTFANHIYKEDSSIRALEWVPLVTLINKSQFEQQASKQLLIDYELVEQTKLGNVIKAVERSFYAPVYYIYPATKNKQAFGLDLLLSLDKKFAMDMSASLGTSVATAPLTLIQDDMSNPGVLVFQPIYSRHKNAVNNVALQKAYPLISGYIVAVLQFERFFKQIAQQQNDMVTFLVEDISVNEPFILYGESVKAGSRLIERLPIDVFTRDWSITIAEKNHWIVQEKSWQTWTMLIGATLGGILFQLLFLLMAVYSIELSHKVTLKTRESLLAKEKSDNENQAKTEFLQRLSGELRTPFNVIKRLTQTFPDKELSEQSKTYLSNMSEASFNLEQLIDTLSELSSIESGQVSLNNQPFDFMIFLNRMESMLKVSNRTQGQVIKFLIAKDIPNFINSDELRLQKVFIAMAENAAELLSCNSFCIATKIHVHKQNKATLFFVLTPIEDGIILKKNANSLAVVDNNIANFNTSMAMVQELCTLFDGDLKLATLPSGNVMLNVSIKINLYQSKQ